MLQKAAKGWWTGRVDGDDPGTARWHQKVVIGEFQPAAISQPSIALTGYASDLGSTHNQGRAGSADGPLAIRQAFGNLPWQENIRLIDTGDIKPEGSVEKIQQELAEHIFQWQGRPCFTIVLGGSHDLSYGHFAGIRKYLQTRSPGCTTGVINLDPHLDLRPYPKGAHSGSPFLQIADWLHSQNEAFKYLCVGTRDYANTPSLWMKARELGVEIIDGSLSNWRHINQVEAKICRFIEGLDYFLLSIDMDSFNAATAPGVSAPAHLGCDPAFIELLLPCLVETGKMAGLDIAETNPHFDQDQRTSRLSAALMYRILQLLSSPNESRFSMTVF